MRSPHHGESSSKRSRRESDRKSSRSEQSSHRSKDDSSVSAPPPPTIRNQSPTSSESLVQVSTIGKESSPPRLSTGVSSEWREGGQVVFRGAEGDVIDMKALKKIQIDIRRKIPRKQIEDGPVIRDLGDPMRFSLPRRPDEGSKPMFAREDIVVNSVDEDETKVQKIQINVAPLEEYERKLSEKISGEVSAAASKKRERSERSKSPRTERERSPSVPEASDDEDIHEEDERRDVRARLGSKLADHEEQRRVERKDVRERLGLSAKDRLGGYFRGGRGRGHRGGYRGGYHRGRKSDYTSRRSEDGKYEHEEPSSTTD